MVFLKSSCARKQAHTEENLIQPTPGVTTPGPGYHSQPLDARPATDLLLQTCCTRLTSDYVASVRDLSSQSSTEKLARTSGEKLSLPTVKSA